MYLCVRACVRACDLRAQSQACQKKKSWLLAEERVYNILFCLSLSLSRPASLCLSVFGRLINGLMNFISIN
jgi:hypothetical protein